MFLLEKFFLFNSFIYVKSCIDMSLNYTELDVPIRTYEDDEVPGETKLEEMGLDK
jgi:hypothetical protein